MVFAEFYSKYSPLVSKGVPLGRNQYPELGRLASVGRVEYWGGIEGRYRFRGVVGG